jgi:hypothetical protein
MPTLQVNRVAEKPAPYGSGTIPPPVPSPRQKIVIFTEHRDTLNYLENRISTLLGRREALVIIHGGMGREERMKAQEFSGTTPKSRCCWQQMQQAKASTCNALT